MSRLRRLHEAGVSIWLDTLSRRLLESGDFATSLRDDSVTGATSNPTIFAKAITGSDLYDDQLRRLASGEVRDAQELFFALALDDVRAAAHGLRAAYDGATAATASSRSSAPPISPTTPRPPSRRRPSCSSDLTSPT
jgi:transaldolase